MGRSGQQRARSFLFCIFPRPDFFVETFEKAATDLPSDQRQRVSDASSALLARTSGQQGDQG